MPRLTAENLAKSMPSHLKQFKQPLYSTVGLEAFLEKHSCFVPGRILDIGCGCGAVTNYMAGRHPDVNFLGLDYSQLLIDTGKEIPANQALTNLELKFGNWFDLPRDLVGAVDGIFNVHTLCCMKKIEPALDSLVALKPEWLAFTSLFYEGPLDVLIHIRDHGYPELTDDDPDADFNIFSLPLVRDYLGQKGYTNFFYERFEIPSVLPKPPNGERGTYTMQTEMGPRTQFSGPVHLPWYFVLAKKG